MDFPNISNGFGNFSIPNVPTAHELAIRGELARVEAELQNKRQQLIEDKKAKIKQMSNRELLEAIYIELLSIWPSARSARRTERGADTILL